MTGGGPPARLWLDRDPTPRRRYAATFLVHWIVMILLGAAIVEAVKTGRSWRGWTLPIPPAVGWVLMWVTGAAGVLCVLNLAVRGLGAPWSIALSRRLATDWLNRWTRNPMGPATAASWSPSACGCSQPCSSPARCCWSPPPGFSS